MILNSTAIPQFLFLGASQTFGWQGSYDKTPFPYGIYMQNLLESVLPLNATINGVPGDCMFGNSCKPNYPPGSSGPSGFYARLQKQFDSFPLTHYDWIFILGGANDLNAACFQNNYGLVNTMDSAMERLTSLALKNSSKVVLMPTYLAPLYQTKCQTLYTSFLRNFKQIGSKLEAMYPDQVFVFDSTTLIFGLKYPDYFVDDLHLNAKGNLALAKGLTSKLLLLKNKNVRCHRRDESLIDCGYGGIQEEECTGLGCCWSRILPNPGNKPWCSIKY